MRFETPMNSDPILIQPKFHNRMDLSKDKLKVDGHLLTKIHQKSTERVIGKLPLGGSINLNQKSSKVVIPLENTRASFEYWSRNLPAVESRSRRRQ